MQRRSGGKNLNGPRRVRAMATPMATSATQTTTSPPVVGAPAPDFELSTGKDATFRLSRAVANGPVIVAFFPGAFTGTCTKEMCAFSEGWDAYAKMGAQFIGVSVDSVHAQKAFAERHHIKVPFASDFERRVTSQWGLIWNAWWGPVAKRATFVVDRSGVVRFAHVQEDAGLEPPYAEIQKAVAALK